MAIVDDDQHPVVWSDPPGDKRGGGVGRPRKFQAITDACREHPGQWCEMPTRVWPGQFNRTYGPGFQITSRLVGDERRYWVRWLPTDENGGE